jgi:N,N'-diacetyllegionaminate synthase
MTSNPSPYIIAELANAHNGEPATLHAMVDAVIATGADAIKFQWFSPSTLALKDFEWYPVYEQLMFDESVWDAVIAKAQKAGLHVWADATDSSAIARIARHNDAIHGIKIAATALLDNDHVQRVLAFQKPTLLGVGGHDDATIDALVARYKQTNPQLIIQHGIQAYPTKKEDATLARIPYLAQRLELPQSFADHEAGDSELAMRMPEYAYFAGAEIIEKHICLDRASEPYDYFSSLEPAEFTAFVTNMRELAAIRGTTEVTDAQRAYLKAATYAICTTDKQPGDMLFADDVIYRRTGQQGLLTPEALSAKLPAKVTVALSENQGIKAEDIRTIRTIACVPCRMKSSRLKHKAMLPIDGLPSIERCLINAGAIHNIERVVLLTSTHPDDDVLETFAKQRGYECIRGSEDDVLARMLAVHDAYTPDLLLRITGDCPLVSYEAMEFMINAHVKSGADASYCHKDVAVGLVGDVYSTNALLKLRALIADTNFSEYLIMYFINNPDIFTSLHVELPERFQKPEWRLTLDEAPDLTLIDKLYAFANVGRMPLAYDSVERFFTAYPEAAKINGNVGLAYADKEALIQEIKQKTTIATAA